MEVGRRDLSYGRVIAPWGGDEFVIFLPQPAAKRR